MNHIDKNTNYVDYITEYITKNISYSEYFAEDISYCEYFAENVSSEAIIYSDYIAEHLDKNIQYSEYIAENLYGTHSETESEKAERIRLMRSKKLNRILNEMDI